MATRITTIVTALALVATAILCLVSSDRGAAEPLPAAPADASLEELAPPGDAPAARRVETAERARGAGWYSAPVGTRLRYDLRMVADLELRDEEGQVMPSTSGRNEIAAVMSTHVLARRGDEVVVRVSFDATKLETAYTGARAEAYRQLLADGIEMKVTGAGDITGLRFATPSVSDDRNLVRGMLAAMRFVVPSDAAGSWDARELDLTGEGRVRYRLLGRPGGADVRRQLLGYAGEGDGPALGSLSHGRPNRHARAFSSGSDRESLAESTDSPAFSRGRPERELTHLTDSPPVRQAPTAGGEVVAQLSREHGWWIAASGREHRSLPLAPIGVTAHEAWTLDVRLVDVDRAAPASDVDWEGAWLPLAPAEASELAASRDEDARRAAVAGVSLDGALQPVLQLLAEDEAHSAMYALAMQRLADVLRFDAGAAAELGRRLVGGEFETAVGSPLLCALGMAGEPACQSALASVLAMGPAPALREAAARAMAQLAEPRPGTLEVLWRTCDHGGELQDTEAAALSSLASLAGRAGPLREQTERRLLAYQTAGRGPTATAAWLEALGRAGIAGAGEIAERYLTSGDVLARHSAVGALAKLSGDAARRLLRDAALGDAEGAVRARALSLLARRGALDVVAAAAQRDPDPRVREYAQSLLPKKGS